MTAELCSAGKVLIGVESLGTGGDAGNGETEVPSREIDEAQERNV